MFIQGGAVEMGEDVNIGWTMCRHPVENHADSQRMRAIDKAGEAVGIAKALAWREQADRLVAPGRIERMFRDGQQLDMGKAQISNIREQALREFIIGEEIAIFAALPGPEMNLIDRHRRPPRLGGFARAQKRGIVPDEIIGARNDRGG
jgi:hypothetical protein